MAQLVKRVTLAGSETPVEFTGYLVSKFLVKNFSDGNVYASLETPLVENESIKIASNMYQVVFNNEDVRWNGAREFSTIYLNGTGEVEIDAICYREDPNA